MKTKYSLNEAVVVTLRGLPVQLFVKAIFVDHRMKSPQYILAEKLYDESHSIQTVMSLKQYDPVKPSGSKLRTCEDVLNAVWDEAFISKLTQPNET